MSVTEDDSSDLSKSSMVPWIGHVHFDILKGLWTKIDNGGFDVVIHQNNEFVFFEMLIEDLEDLDARPVVSRKLMRIDTSVVIMIDGVADMKTT